MIKLINYVDDALYTSTNEETRLEFETNLKKKFNLTLMGQAKWYLGIRIKQHKDYMSIDQEQYVENITSRFEKVFKHPFQTERFSITNKFHTQQEKIVLQLNYR